MLDSKYLDGGRAMKMKPSTPASLAAAVVLGAVACSSAADGLSDGEAACAAPTLFVEPAAAAAGDSVTVSAEGMMDGCADVHGVGSDRTEVALETQEPYEQVDIQFTFAGADPVTLATVDASEFGSFTVEVVIPDVDSDGAALIEAKGTRAEGVELTVTP